MKRLLALTATAAVFSTSVPALAMTFEDIVAAQSAALAGDGFSVVEAKRRILGGAKIEAVGPGGRMEITLNAAGEIVKQEFYGTGSAGWSASSLPAGTAAAIEAALGGAPVGAFELSRMAGGGVEVEVTGPDGTKVERLYDADGRLLKEEITAGGIKTEITYGPDGQVLKREVERDDDDDDDRDDDDDDRDDDDDDGDDDGDDDRDDDDRDDDGDDDRGDDGDDD